jgi:hypothetical protein
MKISYLKNLVIAYWYVTRVTSVAIPDTDIDADADAHIVGTLPTRYPTTITKITSTVTTTTIAPNPAWPVAGVQSYITTLTDTFLEPWTSAPTAFPYTLIQTRISDMTSTYVRGGEVQGATPPVSYVSSGSTILTVPSTWVLYQPAATHLGAGTMQDDLPCAKCTPAGWTPDPRCSRHNLDTACQGQCSLRDGLFWCYKRYYNEPGAPVMGRVCWGNNDTSAGGKMFEYAQLVEPCLQTDHRIQCTPCTGLESNWSPGNWLVNP